MFEEIYIENCLSFDDIIELSEELNIPVQELINIAEIENVSFL